MYKNRLLLLVLIAFFSSSISIAQETFKEDTSNTYLLETTADDDYEEYEEDDGLISVNFQNADVNQVIAVLSDITETIIIPHEGLTGEVNIISLDRVAPNVVSNILESALMVKGFTLVRSGDVLKVVPISETKQTNVAVRIGSSPNSIEDEDIVITQVMPLRYSSAVKLKTILQPLVGKHGNLIANERTNTFIVTDISSNIKRLATIIDQMEHPQPPDIQVKTFFINYGDAEKIAEILNDLSKDSNNEPYPLASQGTLEGGGFEIYGEIQAFAEVETSSIVVATAPINLPAINSLIGELDVFPPQAMIEVVIMDVTLDDDFKMGIEFSDATTPSSTTAGVLKDFNGDGNDESIFSSLLGLATDAATEGFTYRILNSKQTIQALAFINKSQENTKVLSTPKILASNNQESSITVGQEVPIIESSTTDLVNNVTNVDFRYEDIGVILTVTPRISRDDYVNMKVTAKLTDLSPQTILNASVINKREANATVIIPNGHTVVLGGLMRDNLSDIQKKIPVLGDIPLVGIFFKKTTTDLLKTELLIFLTPHIVKNRADLDKISNPSSEKLNTMRQAQSKEDLINAVHGVVGYDEGEVDTFKEAVFVK